MESKRKKRKVVKAVSVTPAPEKSRPPQDNTQEPKRSREQLIRHNGNLIESLLFHEGWKIVEDLIDEGVASVVGRKTNGYYYDGDLTRSTKSKDYLTGYQEALTQLYNRVKSFIKVRDEMFRQEKEQKLAELEPVVNSFMEEFNEEEIRY
jgi:hypothetical protein